MPATRQNIAVIGVTPGEPAGIGPDLLIQLSQQPQQVQLVAIASPDLLTERARQLGLTLTLTTVDSQPRLARPGELFIDPIKLPAIPRPGVGDPASAGYLLQTLQRAATGCMHGKLHALVTGPINKHLINQGLQGNGDFDDTAFTGHTEYLAKISATSRVVMMLTVDNGPALNRPLRVALATTHLPLSQVADAIQPAMLEETLQILQHDLTTRFGISKPNIMVCSLNPHAGEQGDLGREEIDIIQPCLEKLRSQGMQLSDVLPADTLFTSKYLDQADAVLAMYHDQGLPVLKSHGFGRAVNITLGLPYIRTSVDHGTAFDLAGTGSADTGSLQQAIDCAASLCQSTSKLPTN